MIFGRRITEGSTLPISWNDLGIRLFEGLWNFRANLINFQTAYNDYFTDDEKTKILDVLKALEIEYRNKLKEEDAKKSGKKIPPLETVPEYDKELAKKIEDFNNSLTGKVRQFRLGSRIDDNGNPSQHIRQIVDNKFYSGDAFGIYIHPTQASNFLKLLDKYFDII